MVSRVGVVLRVGVVPRSVRITWEELYSKLLIELE